MSSDWQNELDRAIDERLDSIVAVRRHLHANPELSGEETQTSLYLYQLLGDEQLSVRVGPEGRGVVADLTTGGDNGQELTGMIAMRADIDALRIHDAKQVDYRSQCDGKMHACGHDAHSALVYGAMTSLNDMQRADLLPCEVKTRAIFQPAEETCMGAEEMIEVGALEGVDAIVATHVDPSRPVGHIGYREGALTANCDEMQITIVGRGGHAARPHETSDPILTAAQLINSMYLYVPRATDSQDSVVVTIGQMIGGDTANVIPEEVILRGTVRTLRQSVRTSAFDHIRHLAESIGQTTDTQITVEFGRGARSVRNDKHLLSLLRQSGREVVGDEGIDTISRSSMGSEDFAYYLDHVPGAMIRLGCASDRAGNSPLHSQTFDVDEEALRIGAKVLARTVVYWSLARTKKPEGVST